MAAPEQMTRRRLLRAGVGVAAGGALVAAAGRDGTGLGGTPAPTSSGTPPIARLAVQDAGVVLRHGDGPGGCDVHGARDPVVWPVAGRWYMHYDGAGPDGWRLCVATSVDGVSWTKLGPVLELGPPGAPDSASASYGMPRFDGTTWHLYYVGTPNASDPPERVPEVPYYTLYAQATRPEGPWTKRPDVTPFRPQAGTYYAASASPGSVVERDGEFLQFFSASAGEPLQRTLGIARTRDLAGSWTVDPAPIVPATEQIENSAMYFEPANGTWFLFTNHVSEQTRHTDAVWVYWTSDLDAWNPARKALVVDGAASTWSKGVIGLPAVARLGDRLALCYDGLAGDGQAHTGRDVGLAWLSLPLTPPSA